MCFSVKIMFSFNKLSALQISRAGFLDARVGEVWRMEIIFLKYVRRMMYNQYVDSPLARSPVDLSIAQQGGSGGRGREKR